MASNNTIVPGFRFSPKDEEMLNFFLRRKMNREPELGPPYPRIRDDINPYFDHPATVFGRLGMVESEEDDTERYLFTSLRNKSGSSSGAKKNKCRSVGKDGLRKQGVWKNQKTEDVFGKDVGVKIGSKKLLSFQPNDDANKGDVNWVMHEYSSSSSSDFVICRLKRILPAATAKKQQRQQQENNQWWASVVLDDIIDIDDFIRAGDQPLLLDEQGDVMEECSATPKSEFLVGGPQI